MCLEEGPEGMYLRLKRLARQSAIHGSTEAAADDALLVSEGIPDIPTLEELRELSRKTVFRERNRLLGQKGGA